MEGGVKKLAGLTKKEGKATKAEAGCKHYRLRLEKLRTATRSSLYVTRARNEIGEAGSTLQGLR
jgi:hypothetical protein